MDGAHTFTCDDADRLAHEAISMAAQHGTPPSPDVFEVWWNYASGRIPNLNKEVDDILSENGRITARELSELHAKHCSHAALEKGVDVISDEIAVHLTRIATSLDGGIDRAEQFETSCKKLSSTLPRMRTSDELARAARHLIDLSHQQVGTTRELCLNLAGAREQIAELQRELGDLREDAFTDHLTKIANRRRFDQVLASEIRNAQAIGAPLALGIADIDHFKAVNDKWGHGAGDRVLQKFAELLKSNIKGQDTAARLGGEEFALILPNTSVRGAHALSDRIRRYFGAMRFVARGSGERLGRITVSFGIAALRGGENEEALLDRADSLLYAAKNAGRDQVKSAI